MTDRPDSRIAMSLRATPPAVSGHSVQVTWRGKRVDTLADLLRPGLLAVVVGINPAPVSVAAGHYWQGRLGTKLWKRLGAAGLLAEGSGHADDNAFAAGVGFTDVVKRPTPRADDLSVEELEHGRVELEKKLATIDAPLVIFAFKKAATTLLGPFEGNGLIERTLGPAEVFVMPGPYAAREEERVVVEQLAARVAQLRPAAGRGPV
jgi:TDG/mug DNA glycosylase family protein